MNQPRGPSSPAAAAGRSSARWPLGSGQPRRPAPGAVAVVTFPRGPAAPPTRSCFVSFAYQSGVCAWASHVFTSAPRAIIASASEASSLDLGEGHKGVAVTLDYTGTSTATLRSVEVFRGRAHGRGAGPPMLEVELLDVAGTVTGRFKVSGRVHAAHPGGARRVEVRGR